MPLWFIVVADLALLYLFFGHSLHYRLLPKRRQQRAALKASERHLAHLLHRDRDLLPEEKRQKIEAVLATLREALASGDDGRIALAAKRYGKYDPVTPSSSESFLKSLADVLFFILMLAFGARALFIQPFKIPTSSMEPTLYGIHFQALPAEAVPDNPLRQAFDWANLSRRYVRETVSQDGSLLEVFPANPDLPLPGRLPGLFRPLLPTTGFNIGNAAYLLPGTPHQAAQANPKLMAAEYYLQQQGRLPPIAFQQGETLACGAAESGDHLFVDRTYLAFHEPRRGDVIVFTTDGLGLGDGRPLAGKYYIKRLVGLPGDTLRITDHRLYLKADGATEFRLVDGSVAPAFERIYSQQGGYRGYCHLPGSRFLVDNEAEFLVPAGHYFMMGDNSERSSDSRFFGAVPRRNLVGRALLVWWPFSRRWGWVDRVGPEAFASPSTVEDRRPPE